MHTPHDPSPTASPASADERARLQELLDLDLLSPDIAPLLQDLVDQACAALDLPIALVSLVLDDAQYFAASRGLGGWIAAANGTPVEWSFCRFAVADRAPFAVEDATQHPRTHDNPLVLQDGIRCYLGVPLTTSRGHTLGTLCVAGASPRPFSDADRASLRALADQALSRVEARAGRTPPNP